MACFHDQVSFLNRMSQAGRRTSKGGSRYEVIPPMPARVDQRALVRSLFCRGVRNPSVIFKQWKVPYATARRYVRQLSRGESLEDKPRSGRPRKLTPRLRRQLSQLKRQYPKKKSTFFARLLSRRNKEKISARSVRRAFHDIGYRWRLRPRRALTQAQRQARVQFALAHREDSWDLRWFFDESYFNLYRHGNRYWVRVKTDDAISLSKLTAAQEKVSIGIAVAISRDRKSALAFLPKNWKAPDLVSVFDRVLLPSMSWSNRIGKQNELVMDNDGRHFANDWLRFVEQKRLRPIRPWSANSPDFNAVENVFAWMKASVEDSDPTTEQQLREAILRAWNDLDHTIIRNLVDSMPRRLEKAIELNGGRTKY